MPADAPRARLEIKVGPHRGARFELAGEATLGRHPDNEVVLEPSAISARHARIGWDSEAGSYFVEDLGSRNGTALDGVPVTGRERLGRLHVITLGGLDLIFHGPALTAGRKAIEEEGTLAEQEAVALPGALAEPAGPEPEPKTETEPEPTRLDMELPPMPAALAEPVAPSSSPDAEPETGPDRTYVDLELPPLPTALTDPPSAGARSAEPEPPPASLRLLNFGPVRDLPLVEGENRIGRAGDAEVAIPSPDVSRLHAVLTVRGGRIRLRDAASRNRTFVGGEPLAEGSEVELAPGAGLRFGSVEAELIGPESGGQDDDRGDPR